MILYNGYYIKHILKQVAEIDPKFWSLVLGFWVLNFTYGNILGLGTSYVL